MRLYNHTKIERKWQAKWLRSQVYEPRLAGAKKPFYNLMMFPYPSAEGLHVGNVYAFTGSDIYGRFKRMQGYDVFEPIGLDGFGIHSENYALSIGKHPMKLAKVTEKTFYRQLGMIGNGFSWKERLETYDPEYYRWTQWIFLQMYKHGLAYRKKSPVNWCPSCKTVLADEQVISGACERCGTPVVQKEFEQWFFKITEYAEKLLKNLETLDWSERVKIAQRNWIGRSEGATIRFKLIVPGQAERHAVDVFTTRPDTLFGATFLAVSPELAKRWLDIGWKLAAAVKRYIEKSLAARGKRDEAAAKTGVFSGIQAVNPVNQKKIPVWVTDYVLGSVGTGALFGDAHDERDVAFAKKYHIPLKPTLKTGDAERDARIKRLEVCFTDDGILYDSGKFSGLTSAEARTAITQWLEEKKQGRATRVYRLRDWLISRQRYWGPPIPMIYCEKCARLRQGFGGQGWQPVPEKDLPVKLPFVKNFRPTGTEKSPLASVPAFYKVKCPVCKGPARRETDVSDTFLDSAWYFFRYIDVKNKKAPFSKKRAKTWLPVHMYIGGAEHAVLHLLYTRFLTMAFHDFGLTHFEEPFTTFRAHGLLIKEGAKMSKSKGNIVTPDEYIERYGADALRCYLMFLGPFSEGGDFQDTGIAGITRFLQRVWRLAERVVPERSRGARLMHQTIKRVTEDIEGLRYNTALAALMEYSNALGAKPAVGREEYRTLLLLLAPFAPHISEELWSRLGEKFSIHKASWPAYNPNILKKDTFELVIQVNGQVRDRVIAPAGIEEKAATEMALEREKVKTYLKGAPKKVIFVPGRLINLVK